MPAGRRARGGRVRKVVAHVREVGPPGTDAAAGRDRLLEREMRRVRAVAQRVEHEHVEAFEQRPTSGPGCGCSRSGRQSAPKRSPRIGRVAVHRAAPARPPGGRRRTRRAIVKVTICGSPPPFCVARIERVRERLTDVGDRPRIAVARHGALLQHVEAAHIVHAEDVIGVAVGEENGVDAADPVRQRLLAQVGAGIDEQRRAVVGLDEDRGPEPAIARVGRPAGAAVAADHRHAARRSGAEKRDLQGSMIRLSSCCAWT